MLPGNTFKEDLLAVIGSLKVCIEFIEMPCNKKGIFCRQPEFMGMEISFIPIC